MIGFLDFRMRLDGPPNDGRARELREQFLQIFVRMIAIRARMVEKNFKISHRKTLR
jgi:hypothetical protein